ncbi:hypothetical protein R1flu_019937 [Riccia fluitans]|uniref:Uncharacterized protein n=1 Tax=Riccia fluitans TaxID=41844 RepID=A0ABD1ZK31_9MARC
MPCMTSLRFPERGFIPRRVKLGFGDLRLIRTVPGVPFCSFPRGELKGALPSCPSGDLLLSELTLLSSAPFLSVRGGGEAKQANSLLIDSSALIPCSHRVIELLALKLASSSHLACSNETRRVY